MSTRVPKDIEHDEEEPAPALTPAPLRARVAALEREVKDLRGLVLTLAGCLVLAWLVLGTHSTRIDELRGDLRERG